MKCIHQQRRNEDTGPKQLLILTQIKPLNSITMTMEENQTLSNAQIVDRLAKERVVEEICRKITKGKDSDTLKDLCQEIYMQLLESDKTQGLYERDEIRF
jgi:hypothetical protein